MDSPKGRRSAFPILIGDIGGTNARFSLVEDAEAEMASPAVVETARFDGIETAIRAVLPRLPARPLATLLAVAGPVDGDAIELTNCPWVVRPRALISEFGFREVTILNDFEAQALAAVELEPQHLEQIGGGRQEQNAARVVLGPGTGLGVAGLVHAFGRWVPVPGEGGHMDIGPRTARDFEIFPHIERIEGRISGEQILCGRGLLNLYGAVAKAGGGSPRLASPPQITHAALAGDDPVAAETLSLFSTYLGRTAGDLALVFKAQGGVYLTGGIAQKIVPALKGGPFRAAFEDKAPHSEMMRAIPVYVITHPLAALAGLAAFARIPDSFGVETRGRRWLAAEDLSAQS